MSIQITTNVKTLMAQAPMTANDYMIAGIERIDRAFGEGYAKEGPALLGAFIEASATDFLTSVIGNRCL
jgi:hypothetical protein